MKNLLNKLRHKLRRLSCRLQCCQFESVADDSGYTYECVRCELGPYDYGAIHSEQAWLRFWWNLILTYKAWERFQCHDCMVCGKRVYQTDSPYCSRWCCDNDPYLPF